MREGAFGLVIQYKTEQLFFTEYTICTETKNKVKAILAHREEHKNLSTFIEQRHKA